MEILIGLLTILGPILSVGVTAWADKVKARKQEQPNADIDTNITQALGRDRAGLVNLSRELERLSDKAAAKRHHS